MSTKQKFILLCLAIFFVSFLVTGNIPIGFSGGISRDTDPGAYWLVMLGFVAIVLLIYYRILIAWSKKYKIK